MCIFIPDVNILICHRMVANTVLRMPFKVTCRETEASAKVTGNTDLLRVTGFRLEICISIRRRIKLVRCRRDKVFTVRNISVRQRIDVVAEADARTVVTAECRVAVMTNACCKFQRRKNTPLILQVEGTVQNRAVINAHSTTIPNCRIIFRKLKARGQQMITELLVKLIAEFPRPNAEIIEYSHRIPCIMGQSIIIILTTGDTHLILCISINLDIPNQTAIEMIIVPAIGIQSLLLFIECLIAV